MASSTPQDCMKAFVAAMIARDMNAALALLTEDVTFYYANGTVIFGKDSFAAVMTAAWSRLMNYEYATHEPVWFLQSDTAAAVYYGFSWSGRVGEQQVGGSGRATRVFRRDAGGWRLAHEHLSAGPWKPDA